MSAPLQAIMQADVCLILYLEVQTENKRSTSPIYYHWIARKQWLLSYSSPDDATKIHVGDARRCFHATRIPKEHEGKHERSCGNLAKIG